MLGGVGVRWQGVGILGLCSEETGDGEAGSVRNFAVWGGGFAKRDGRGEWWGGWGCGQVKAVILVGAKRD